MMLTPTHTHTRCCCCCCCPNCSGPVITEPLHARDHLPGALQGIQAVQGQIPYLCEYKDLTAAHEAYRDLKVLEHAAAAIHSALDAAGPDLAAAAAEPGNEWIDADDAALYFEFEARPGFTCNVRNPTLPLEK